MHREGINSETHDTLPSTHSHTGTPARTVCARWLRRAHPAPTAKRRTPSAGGASSACRHPRSRRRSRRWRRARSGRWLRGTARRRHGGALRAASRSSAVRGLPAGIGKGYRYYVHVHVHQAGLGACSADLHRTVCLPVVFCSYLYLYSARRQPHPYPHPHRPPPPLSGSHFSYQW